MNKINEVKLLQLLPESLRDSPDIKAAADAVDLGFLSIIKDIDKVIILPKINEVSEDVLDHLAYFFHVDFYDTSMDVEVKRALVKESIYIHQIKGTPAAVEKLVTILFGESKVIEWFDYEGKPYHFKVLVPISALKKGPDRFLNAVDTIKNTRSYLEQFTGVVSGLVKIQSRLSNGRSKYPLCNEWYAGTWHYHQNFGRIKGGLFKIDTDKELKEFKYPETALVSASEETFQIHEFAKQLTIEQLLTLDSVVKAVDYEYVKVLEILSGEHPDLLNEIKSILKEFNLRDRVAVGSVEYPMCNDTISGGGN